MKLQLTKEQEEGVKAIIYLQSVAGIEEPEARALKGWNAMDKRAQDWTMQVYNSMKPNEGN